METKLQSQSISTQLRDFLKTYYDGFYSALGHNHDAAYSAIVHNHNTAYSAIGHQHTARQIILMHANYGTIAAGGTMYLIPSIFGLTSLGGFYMPVAGTAWNMSCKVNSAQPATGSLVFTLQLGLANTACVVSFVNADGASLKKDTTHGVSYAVDNIFCIAIKNNASTASAQITGVSIEYDIPTI